MLAKLLIVSGCILVISGFLLHYELPFLGKLPGDIVIKKEHLTVYIPLTSMIVLSLALSLFLYFLKK